MPFAMVCFKLEGCDRRFGERMEENVLELLLFVAVAFAVTEVLVTLGCCSLGDEVFALKFKDLALALPLPLAPPPFLGADVVAAADAEVDPELLELRVLTSLPILLFWF